MEVSIAQSLETNAKTAVFCQSCYPASCPFCPNTLKFCKQDFQGHQMFPSCLWRQNDASGDGMWLPQARVSLITHLDVR